ncbi:hypothetical protein FHS89_002190 [Rubricella aquisinus]|uniref:Uncharacterized protein n=1 Tax=Rubricella aquisinus TaxID=2028108 RepID=A0A840X0B3_9RHOB|nr:hypothetical protein [Rubricella aquisinus]MBB5516164.1 hypothetical protein [Rubricella aquisinus]
MTFSKIYQLERKGPLKSSTNFVESYRNPEFGALRVLMSGPSACVALFRKIVSSVGFLEYLHQDQSVAETNFDLGSGAENLGITN